NESSYRGKPDPILRLRRYPNGFWNWSVRRSVNPIYGKNRDVAALWQRYGCLASRRLGVVFPQFVPKSSGVHAHDGIDRAIELLAFAIKLGSQDLLFKYVALTGKGPLGHEAKERTQALGAQEQFARE